MSYVLSWFSVLSPTFLFFVLFFCPWFCFFGLGFVLRLVFCVLCPLFWCLCFFVCFAFCVVLVLFCFGFVGLVLFFSDFFSLLLRACSLLLGLSLFWLTWSLTLRSF